MKYNIGSYSIERLTNGDLKIDYKRSSKDIFYILVYFVISVVILAFDYKLITYLINEKINFNVIIGYFFSFCLLLTGLYFLIVSIETLVKPTNNVFVVNSSRKQLHIKLNLFKKSQYNFSEIRQFNLRAKDITVVSSHEGRTYKRPLFLIQMDLELLNNKNVKIHQFEGSGLLISLFEKKKNKSLKEISKQVTNIISKECCKEFFWQGTQKE